MCNVDGVSEKLRICVAGGAGFIGSHLAQRLMRDGHYVVVADKVANDFMTVREFCHEFHKVDLRDVSNCEGIVCGCDQVYNLAADMGGMGFIASNQSVLMANNTDISKNMLVAVFKENQKRQESNLSNPDQSKRLNPIRYFLASTACVYNEDLQNHAAKDSGRYALRECDAWPANPQDTYGLEKIYAERMAEQFGSDFKFPVRVARYHNVYGPRGTWKGGREKAPAACCRKAAAAAAAGTDFFELWGDGQQVRSFMHINDCVEGTIRIMNSEHALAKKPLNLGSDRAVTILELAKMAIRFSGKEAQMKIRHRPGPEGVRARTSDNALLKQALGGWEPSIVLEDGLRQTYDWIAGEIEKEQVVEGTYCTSEVLKQNENALKLTYCTSGVVKQNENALK